MECVDRFIRRTKKIGYFSPVTQIFLEYKTKGVMVMSELYDREGKVKQRSTLRAFRRKKVSASSLAIPPKGFKEAL